MTRSKVKAALEATGETAHESTAADGLQGLTRHKDGTWTIRESFFYGNDTILDRLEKNVTAAGFTVVRKQRRDRSWPAVSYYAVTFRTPEPGSAPQDVVDGIAREHLLIGSLERRGRDAHDFHEVAVWNVQAALEAAYRAGFEAARK